jgi:hypothetical protein
MPLPQGQDGMISRQTFSTASFMKRVIGHRLTQKALLFMTQLVKSQSLRLSCLMIVRSLIRPLTAIRTGVSERNSTSLKARMLWFCFLGPLTPERYPKGE